MEHSKTDHILDHKTNLTKLETTEITQTVFYNHNEIKIENSTRKRKIQKLNTWKLKNTFLNNRQDKRDLEKQYNKLIKKKRKLNISQSGCGIQPKQC